MNRQPGAQGSLSNCRVSGKSVPSLIRMAPGLIVSNISVSLAFTVGSGRHARRPCADGLSPAERRDLSALGCSEKSGASSVEYGVSLVPLPRHQLDELRTPWVGFIFAGPATGSSLSAFSARTQSSTSSPCSPPRLRYSSWARRAISSRDGSLRPNRATSLVVSTRPESRPPYMRCELPAVCWSLFGLSPLT